MALDATGRLAWISLTAGTRPKLDFLGESVLTLTVSPMDLDAYGHMNNGRYLTLMDLGRVDLLIRNGLLGASAKKGWRPLVGAASIAYRQSLEPFQQYQLHTRLVGWDAKWFYFLQQFKRHEKLCAQAMVRGLLRGRWGNVPAGEVVQESGGPDPGPPLPSAVSAWVLSLEHLKELSPEEVKPED